MPPQADLRADAAAPLLALGQRRSGHLQQHHAGQLPAGRGREPPEPGRLLHRLGWDWLAQRAHHHRRCRSASCTTRSRSARRAGWATSDTTGCDQFSAAELHATSSNRPQHINLSTAPPGTRAAPTSWTSAAGSQFDPYVPSAGDAVRAATTLKAGLPDPVHLPHARLGCRAAACSRPRGQQCARWRRACAIR